VKAIEMEGAGVADATWAASLPGYLVVRGICDYCDENKGDAWQPYAAVAAAAVTRAILEGLAGQEESARPQ
jgi:nucleoside phosphorylase